MSRSDARSTSLRRRPARVVPATIVALIVLASGVGLVWVSVLRLRDGTWPTFLERAGRWATGVTWGSAVMIAIAAAAAVLGLILLVAGIKPGPPNALAMATDSSAEVVTGTTEIVMSRRAVATLATSHASQVDGIDRASASVAARRVTLRVTSASGQRDQLQISVTSAVKDALQHAGVQPLPAVRTTVRTTRP